MGWRQYSSAPEGSVDTTTILDGTVQAIDLADGSVTVTKIGTGAVTDVKIGTGAVTSAKLGAASVTAGKIGVGGISNANQFAAGVVDNAAIGTDAVDTDELKANSVTAAKIVEKTGSAIKLQARVVAVANVNTAAPGATRDGVTLVSGDRMLLTAQTAGSENGLWVWNGASSALTRPIDFDTSSDVTQGHLVAVAAGTIYFDSVWLCTTDGAITLGTTALAYKKIIPAINMRDDARPVDLILPASADRGLHVPGYHRHRWATDQLQMGKRRNLWQYTEDLGSNRYSVDAYTTKQTDTIIVDGITLTRLTATSFYSQLRSQMSGLYLTPFVADHRYLMSCYAVSRSEDDKFIWMKHYLTNGSGYAHDAKLVGSRMRRIWKLVQAADASTIYDGADDNPALAWNAEAIGDPTWFLAGVTATTEIYLGGFQIDEVSESYVDGIAMIGDSTMAGSAAKIDLWSSREVSRYIEGLLNVPVYNRAVGGDKYSDMITRWAADITTIKHRCKYVIIQGGLNDFANSVSLATVKADVATLVGYAIADGLIPVLFTCTPTVGIADVAADEANRVAFNTWLKQTYPNVIDIASVVASPSDASMLNRDTDWYGDGVHYGLSAKRAIGAYVSAWPGWSFLEPSPYQPIPVATFTPSINVVGAKGGNAALASLLTQLQASGIITDASTA